MSDMLSDKFSGLPNATTQYALARDACEGGSDPTELLGGSSAKKRGRSRPIWCFFLCHFSHSRVVYFLVSRDLCASQGEEDGEDEAEVSNSYLLRLPRPNPRRTRAHLQEASCWAGATHDSLWPRNRVQKWGRSSPTRCYSAAILTFLSCATSSPLGICSIARVNARVTDRVICVFHAPVTFPRCKY